METKSKVELHLNGYNIKNVEPKMMFSTILQHFSDFKYWSYEALVNLYTELPKIVVSYCTEVLEHLKGTEKTKLRNHIKKLESLEKFVPKTREQMIAKLYEIILGYDNCSPLRGFGFNNGMGNSEITRMSKNYTIKEYR